MMRSPAPEPLQPRRRTALAWLVGAIAAGCGGDDAGPEELALVHVAANELGSVPAGNVVFRSRPEWEAFWAANPHGLYPGRQVPSVDFSTHAVAGVFAGAKGRCNRLDIVRGEIDRGTVTLRWRITTFGISTPSSCLGNDPFVLNLADLVLVPASATEVRFEAE